MNYLLIAEYLRAKVRAVALTAKIKVRGWLGKY